MTDVPAFLSASLWRITFTLNHNFVFRMFFPDDVTVIFAVPAFFAFSFPLLLTDTISFLEDLYVLLISDCFGTTDSLIFLLLPFFICIVFLFTFLEPTLAVTDNFVFASALIIVTGDKIIPNNRVATSNNGNTKFFSLL